MPPSATLHYGSATVLPLLLLLLSRPPARPPWVFFFLRRASSLGCPVASGFFPRGQQTARQCGPVRRLAVSGGGWSKAVRTSANGGRVEDSGRGAGDLRAIRANYSAVISRRTPDADVRDDSDDSGPDMARQPRLSTRHLDSRGRAATWRGRRWTSSPLFPFCPPSAFSRSAHRGPTCPAFSIILPS